MVSKKKTWENKLARLERKLEQDIKRVLRRGKNKIGVGNVALQISVATEVWGPPVVDENVYAQAFPFEHPPKVWIEVWPEATAKEITGTIYHELVHIKHPELDEDSVEKKTTEYIRSRN